jgi:hypothetical protein
LKRLPLTWRVADRRNEGIFNKIALHDVLTFFSKVLPQRLETSLYAAAEYRSAGREG